MTTKENDTMATAADTDYQATFRAGAAWGRMTAIADTLTDLAFIQGVLDAGGTINAESMAALVEQTKARYADSSEKYRVAANIPA